MATEAETGPPLPRACVPLAEEPCGGRVLGPSDGVLRARGALQQWQEGPKAGRSDPHVCPTEKCPRCLSRYKDVNKHKSHLN